MTPKVETAFLAATLLFAPPSAASPAYRADLERVLGLPAPALCTLCHAAEAPDGGRLPVTTPFGHALVARGLRGGDAASLEDAVARLRADGVDSDGDGAEDLDELAWGGDPNVPDLPREKEVPPPAYGCAVAPAARRTGSSTPYVLGLVAVAIQRRRSRIVRRPAPDRE